MKRSPLDLNDLFKACKGLLKASESIAQTFNGLRHHSIPSLSEIHPFPDLMRLKVNQHGQPHATEVPR